VLLEILGSFESLAAEVTLMRLQRHVNTNVRGDMITLDCSGTAVPPLAGEVQVVGTLATDMALADVIVELFSRGQALAAVLPLTNKLIA